jgi:RNA polymerase sigma-70 factor (ECF subfamily)
MRRIGQRPCGRPIVAARNPMPSCLGNSRPSSAGLTRDLARFGSGSGNIEDVVQDCLLALHLKRHTWDETRPIMPWLRAISRHKIIDRVQRRARAAEVPLEGHAESLASPEERQAVSVALVERHLANLPPRQRAVVASLALDGATVDETARKLAMSPGAVRVAMHRGIEALTARFGDHIDGRATAR